MKKTLKDIRVLSILLAATATFVACSNDNDLPNVNDGSSISTYNFSVQATKSGPATRALTLDESGAKPVLNATWATTEQVYVVNTTSSTTLGGSLSPESDGADATLKGTLTGSILNDDELALTVPRATIDDTGQVGTLADIAEKYDYATATVTVTDVSTPNVTTTDASFINQQAIVKFTLQDAGGDALNATELTISAAGLKTTEATTGDITVTPTSGTSTIYAALSGISSTAVTLTATVGNDTYSFEKAGVTFTNGKYYEITVKMTRTGVNGRAFVDLGLTSGTLWATMNVGADNETDYGDYIAWGETEGYNSGKRLFYWSTYKWCSDNTPTFTKYSDGSYGTADGLTELEADDDAATVNWGGGWQMPSRAQQDELASQCTWVWTTKNGVNGYEVKSRVNDNSIFMPAAGTCYDTDCPYAAGSKGYYASRTYTSDMAGGYDIYFESTSVSSSNSGMRFMGLSVRPVVKP